LTERVQVTFHRGRWYLGFELPWYAGANDARREFTKRLPHGVTVNVNPKETPLPAGVDPHADPLFHNQKWDTWAEAIYDGPDMSYSLDRSWAWLVYVPPSSAPAALPAPAAPAAKQLPDAGTASPEPPSLSTKVGIVALLFPWGALGLWLGARLFRGGRR
jgi:hypothetical protein